jgi:aryl-alcohol dehydrogenase-like predicted oxidoreductase
VSKIFLGAMTFGDQGGVGAPLDECRRIVDAYADAGSNVIDTAVNYRGGASEEILGELLTGRRDRFVLCTKVHRNVPAPSTRGGTASAISQETRHHRDQRCRTARDHCVRLVYGVVYSV